MCSAASCFSSSSVLTHHAELCSTCLPIERSPARTSVSVLQLFLLPSLTPVGPLRPHTATSGFRRLSDSERGKKNGGPQRKRMGFVFVPANTQLGTHSDRSIFFCIQTEIGGCGWCLAQPEQAVSRFNVYPGSIARTKSFQKMLCEKNNRKSSQAHCTNKIVKLKGIFRFSTEKLFQC